MESDVNNDSLLHTRPRHLTRFSHYRPSCPPPLLGRQTPDVATMARHVVDKISRTAARHGNIAGLGAELRRATPLTAAAARAEAMRLCTGGVSTAMPRPRQRP